MQSISKLVEMYDWTFQVCQQRYGKGIWAIIGQQSEALNNIKDIITGTYIEALELEDYFRNEGSWLPAAYGNTVIESIDNLEKKSCFIDR